MTQQIMLTRNSQKVNQDCAIAKSKTKNTHPYGLTKINPADLMGLSWIFADDEMDPQP